MEATDHNRVLAEATRRAWQLEPRLAKILTPILDAAGTEAARTFEAHATGQLLTAAGQQERTRRDLALVAAGWRQPFQLTAAGDAVSRASTMVALRPTPEQADRLAALTGADPAKLHVTLCYLGETDDDLERFAQLLRPVAGEHAPMYGVIAGAGAFADNGKGAPTIMLPSVPGLVEARVAATQALQRAGVDYSRDYGYVPHMTAGYSDDPEPPHQTVGEPLDFANLHIVRGDREEIAIPFTGAPPLTAAADPDNARVTLTAAGEWTSPPANKLINLDTLTNDLRTKTDPVRLAVVEQAMTPVLQEAGLDFDVTNPFTAKVLAQSGSQITNIAQTTQQNVMAIIARADTDGLSIPDTAKAIRQGMKEASLSRATLIARTELAGAVNGGSLAAAQIVSGADGTTLYKRWLTAPGARYPRHEDYPDLDGQTTTLDGYFEVGDAQLQHPGDPDGPPEEVCNCLPADAP